ncbi:MAG: HAD family hydrolase [Actinobacteria bacterium]|nr:HAD family hydrolase [Actinomycetota bacterium]
MRNHPLWKRFDAHPMQLPAPVTTKTFPSMRTALLVCHHARSRMNCLDCVAGQASIRDDVTMQRPILFDLDRTLVDLQNHTDYAAALADLHSLLEGWSEFEVLDADWDAPTLECMAILVALSNDPRWGPASAAVAAHERAAIPRSTPMPGLAEVGAACVGTPYAVVTLLPPDVAREVLDHHGFPVEVIIGRDPGIRAKPYGDGLVAAAQLLGVDVEGCVMIGDSSWDRAAAVDAGGGFIGVPATSSAFASDVLTASSLVEAVWMARSR